MKIVIFINLNNFGSLVTASLLARFQGDKVIAVALATTKAE